MSQSSPIKRAAALCLVIVTCVGCALLVYYAFFATAREMKRTAVDFAGAVKEALNFTPRVTLDRTVIFQESTPVLELVSNKRKFHHEMRWSSTWLGSTKEIVLSGDFTASAGFDLHEPFSAEFDSAARVVRVTHPRPRILAVQLDSLQASQDPGWWNSITDEDRTAVLNRFTADAKRAAEANSALLDQARKDLREQIEAMLVSSGLKVEFSDTVAVEASPAP